MSVADIHEQTKCLYCGYTGIYDYHSLKDFHIYYVILNSYAPDGELLDGLYCIGPKFMFWMPNNIAEYKHEYRCHLCHRKLNEPTSYILDCLSRGWPKHSFGFGM
jgi:hypothetical protein